MTVDQVEERLFRLRDSSACEWIVILSDIETNQNEENKLLA